MTSRSHRLVADRFGTGDVADSVWVYAAGGYYQPGAGPEALATELTGYVDQGFEHVKMKFGGALLEEDAERVAAVVDAVGDGARVAVDANGRFDLDTALAYGPTSRSACSGTRRPATHSTTR